MSGILGADSFAYFGALQILNSNFSEELQSKHVFTQNIFEFIQMRENQYVCKRLKNVLISKEVINVEGKF